MTAVRAFTELQFWRRARQWSADIFHLARESSFARDRRLAVQINDSSESVMANMAEGFGRVRVDTSRTAAFAAQRRTAHVAELREGRD